MAGNKNSGRRPRPRIEEDSQVWEAGREGVREVTTRTILKEKAQHPVIKKLDRALDESDDMDVSDYIKTVFDCGAEGLWIYRIVNGEEYKVGTLRPGMDVGDDGETFLLNKYGGPGTFVLKPAIKTAYGGLFRASKSKRVRLGLSDQQDAGSFAIPGTDADTIITRTLAREEKIHALNKIKDLNREPVAASQEDGMKGEELLAVVKELKGNDRTSEVLLEMLRSERDRSSALMLQQTTRNPLELLGPLATPLLAFLDKKLSPGMVTKWIDALRAPVAEAAPESFMSMVTGILKEYAPVIQPFLANVAAQMAPQPAITNRNFRTPGPVRLPTPPPVQPVAGATGPPTEGAEDMATRKYADEDTKEVMDYVMTCLDEHKFPEVWAALRTCPDTEDVIAAIMPGADPSAFWFAFKDLDERLRTRKDVSLEFIGYIQKQIEVLIAAQQAAAQQEQPPVDGTTPPAA